MKIGEVYGMFQDEWAYDKLLKSISTTGKSIFINFNKRFDPWYKGWGNIADFVILIKYNGPLHLYYSDWDKNSKGDVVIESTRTSYVHLNFETKLDATNSNPSNSNFWR